MSGHFLDSLGDSGSEGSEEIQVFRRGVRRHEEDDASLEDDAASWDSATPDSEDAVEAFSRAMFLRRSLLANENGMSSDEEEEESFELEDDLDYENLDQFQAFVESSCGDLRQTMYEIKHSRSLFHSDEQLKSLDLDFAEWLVLANRPKARQKFIEAIRKHRQHVLETLTVRIVDSSFGIEEQVTTNEQMAACFGEFGQLFSTFGNLKHLTLKVATIYFDLSEPLALMVSSVQQLVSVTLQVVPQDMEDYVPTRLLECLARMPQVDQFCIQAQYRIAFQESCRHMQQSSSLKGLTVDGTLATDQMALEDEHLQELLGLLQAVPLERLVLQNVRCANVEVARRIWQTVVGVPGLKDLGLLCFHIPEDEAEADFYIQVGNELPLMKDLESFDFWIAGVICNESETLVQCYEDCVASILHGAGLAPKLERFSIPHCVWTTRLAISLVDCLSMTQTLSKLDLRGRIRKANTKIFSVLTRALASSSLVSLAADLSGDVDAAFFDIVAGVNASKTITHLSLEGLDITFHMVSRLCQAIRSNKVLKSFEVVSEDHGWDDQLEDEMSSSPKTMERIREAISDNVELESLILSPFTDYDEGLKSLVEAVIRLNTEGRRYIKDVGDHDFRDNAYRMLGIVKDDLDCLFVHLHDIPMLFRQS